MLRFMVRMSLLRALIHVVSSKAATRRSVGKPMGVCG
jgi:hypothetical protein